MEYCSLGDLSQFIKGKSEKKDRPAGPLREVLTRYPTPVGGGVHEVLIRHFLKQLASALQFLRAQALIHRDVKPQNLLLLPSPSWAKAHPEVDPILSASRESLIPATGVSTLPMLKLADFGFARVLPNTVLADTLCGSPLYMAPEILRYSRYDAKVDLWSVGTVLYEMATGKPPFKATNHIELLRQIELINDKVEFPSRVKLTPGLKDITLALLKRWPTDRISFTDFFQHEVITGPIPGLLEEDITQSIESFDSKGSRGATKVADPELTKRRVSSRRSAEKDLNKADRPLERPYKRSPLSTPTTESEMHLGQPATRVSSSPRQEMGEGLGIRRPQPMPSSSAPSRSGLHEARIRAISNANKFGRDVTGTSLAEPPRSRMGGKNYLDEQEQAQQDIAFERDYVVVDKNQVAVNALADQLADNGLMNRLAQGRSAPMGQIARRTTMHGAPASKTGAVQAAPSLDMQITRGRPRSSTLERRPSLGSKPASFITKAIHGASNRWLGVKLPTDFGKGVSPPQLYNPFAYPVSPAAKGLLIGDGKESASYDEGTRVAQRVEDIATRSDVVYGFAEVKYKQLVPITPSMEHRLGGASANAELAKDDDELTPDAIVSLSEEALVLYVKALSLLAQTIEITNLWWAHKINSDTSGNSAVRNSSNTQAVTERITSAVQWVRARFNEVLEKSEIVRLKLRDAQKSLPEDHPSHPNNWSEALRGAACPYITPGVNAEKLMYERAIEMSRKAAIDELTGHNITGCEITYVTAICMLEAVLDRDEDSSKWLFSGSSKDEATTSREETAFAISPDELQNTEKCEFSPRLLPLQRTCTDRVSDSHD